MKIDLKDIGLNESILREAELYKHLYLARVSAQHKNVYKVITQNGEINAEISGKLNYNAVSNVDFPVVGDWVMVDRDYDSNGSAVIHQILKRRTVFERKAPGTKIDVQIIASNIDILFICMSLNNDFNIRRMERYLSIAWESSALPIVILTKADLCNDIQIKLAQAQSAAPGVDIIIASSFEDNGLENIQRHITKGKTVTFIGSSGVGKSTIINKLLGHNLLATNEVSINDKGRHTTTFRQLIAMPNGGVVIDTPGMREIQIAGADFSKSFSDIEALAQKCRFRDCRHQAEPNCAVTEAVRSGELSVERFESYKKLERELQYSGLNSRQLEHEKINNMFGSMGEMKQARDFVRKKNKR